MLVKIKNYFSTCGASCFWYFRKMRNKGGKKDKFGKWKNKRQNNRNNRGRREDNCTESSPKMVAPSTIKVP